MEKLVVDEYRLEERASTALLVDRMSMNEVKSRVDAYKAALDKVKNANQEYHKQYDLWLETVSSLLTETKKEFFPFQDEETYVEIGYNYDLLGYTIARLYYKGSHYLRVEGKWVKFNEYPLSDTLDRGSADLDSLLDDEFCQLINKFADSLTSKSTLPVTYEEYTWAE